MHGHTIDRNYSSGSIKFKSLVGTGHCEVLGFDEGEMLLIRWAAATPETRRVGEVTATIDAWRAAIRRLSRALRGDAADREQSPQSIRWRRAELDNLHRPVCAVVREVADVTG
jgi:hypothetical protein